MSLFHYRHSHRSNSWDAPPLYWSEQGFELFLENRTRVLLYLMSHGTQGDQRVAVEDIRARMTVNVDPDDPRRRAFTRALESSEVTPDSIRKLRNELGFDPEFDRIAPRRTPRRPLDRGDVDRIADMLFR